MNNYDDLGLKTCCGAELQAAIVDCRKAIAYEVAAYIGVAFSCASSPTGLGALACSFALHMLAAAIYDRTLECNQCDNQ